jgi:hypothetical protein
MEPLAAIKRNHNWMSNWWGVRVRASWRQPHKEWA